VSLAVGAALASSTCFGIASAGQFAAVATTPVRGSLDPRLLADLARRRRWWLAGAAEVVAVCLQYVALRGAPVALVQALLVLGLPVAVVLSGRLTLRTATGTALTTGGIMVFATFQPSLAPEVPDRSNVVLPIALALSAALLARGNRPAVVTGLAAGVITGCAGVLLAAVAATPLSDLVLRPQAYAAAMVGLLAMQVGNAALRAPQIGPSLASLTLSEPITAVLLAIPTLHQTPHVSATALLGALVAILGVLALHAAVSR
jgi:drug/metabolite transporter, DME family